ncbi:hypothetical protein EON64_05630 [archaeon]|nr:MAG: hypothetical protein EON64_05630 [archaeon]
MLCHVVCIAHPTHHVFSTCLGSKLPMAPPLIRATSVDSSSSRPASEQCGSAVSSASGSRERSSVVDGTGHVVDGMIAIRRASSLASVSTVIYEAEDANGTLSSQVLEVEDSVLQDLLAHPDHLLALQQQQQQQQQQQRTEPGEGAEDELEERAILPSEDKSNRNSSQANQQEQQDQQEAGLCASSSPSSLPSSDAPNDSNDEDSAVVSNHVPFQDAFRTPSYSFINGTYYFYQAASETLASSSSFLRSLAGGGASGEEGLSRKRSASRSAVQQEEDERPTSEAVESSDVSKKTRLL